MYPPVWYSISGGFEQFWLEAHFNATTAGGLCENGIWVAGWENLSFQLLSQVLTRINRMTDQFVTCVCESDVCFCILVLSVVMASDECL